MHIIVVVTVPHCPRVRVQRRGHGQKRLARKACVFGFAPLTGTNSESFGEQNPLMVTFWTSVVVANWHGSAISLGHRTTRITELRPVMLPFRERTERNFGACVCSSLRSQLCCVLLLCNSLYPDDVCHAKEISCGNFVARRSYRSPNVQSDSGCEKPRSTRQTVQRQNESSYDRARRKKHIRYNKKRTQSSNLCRIMQSRHGGLQTWLASVPQGACPGGAHDFESAELPSIGLHGALRATWTIHSL